MMYYLLNTVQCNHFTNATNPENKRKTIIHLKAVYNSEIGREQEQKTADNAEYLNKRILDIAVVNEKLLPCIILLNYIFQRVTKR